MLPFPEDPRQAMGAPADPLAALAAPGAAPPTLGPAMPPMLAPGAPGPSVEAESPLLAEMDVAMGLATPDGQSSVSLAFSSEGRPIQLDGEDLRTFMFRFRAMLENAITNMATIHRDAERDRKVYMMLPREQEYDGQPNLVSPVTANKTDGVIAHIRDAVEQTPMVAVSAMGVGRPAEDAAEVSPLLEAWLERELNTSGSREVITSDAVREAAQVGSVLMVLGVSVHETGEPFVQIEPVQLEDVFVDDLNARSVDEVGLAYRKRYRMYELDEMARGGYLDQEAVEKIRKMLSDRERSTPDEKDKGFNPDTGLQVDMSQRTVYVGYMRYRPMGAPSSMLYQCIYHRSSQTPLALRQAPFSDAFDGPNCELVRVGKLAKSIFGRGIPRRLAAVQEMADNAINNHLAVNNLAANPPYQYRANSPFGRYIERNGRFGIRAGVGIPTMGQPDKGDVAPLQFDNNGLNLNDVSVANQFASQATYTEEAIGANSAGRKTLGQFQVEVHKGTIRLRQDLADFSYDMSRLLTKYYAMMCAYKLKPQGIIEVEPGGKLLAAKTVEREEARQVVMDALAPMLIGQMLQPQDFALVEEEIQEMLTHGRIPSGVRPDMGISLSGTKIIADKISELEMLMQFGAFIMTPGMMEVLAQDEYINYHVRSIGNTMGFRDMAKRIPPMPNSQMATQDRNAALQPFQETFARMSTI